MRNAVLALAALIAMPALAQEVPATPQATAPGVADQIDAFLRASPAADVEDDGVAGVTPRDDRRVHGEVSVGVGTGGYRSLYMRSEMPVGDSGRLSLAFGDARYGRGHGPAFGHDPAFGLGPRDRQRCDLEGLTPPRPMDRLGGPNGRCVRPLFP